MEEQLIKKETGQLIKRKGFNWNCRYWNDGEQSNQYAGHRMDSVLSNTYIDSNSFYKRIPFSCTIPTQAMLQKWLREEHNIHIEILLEEDAPYNKFYYRIMKIGKYFTLSHDDIYCKTYEEALEAGLLEALNLIK